jgi:hypothetical protein
MTGARWVLVAVVVLELVGIIGRWGDAALSEQAGKFWMLGVASWLLYRGT